MESEEKSVEKKSVLKVGRGTKLRKNSHIQTIINITTKKSLKNQLQNVMMIFGDILIPLNHVGIASKTGISVYIPSQTQYMIINTSDADLGLKYSQNFEKHEIIYNPYLYEDKKHSKLDPKFFQDNFDVPKDYIDILTKWYSVKFSYKEYNLIFLRPELGISLQSHSLREEHWEILGGAPIVIHGSKISYNSKIGSKFEIPLGNLHTIINQSKTEWVLLKETYLGKFDEQDIVRVFNPNKYS